MISGANTVVQLRAAPPMRGRVLALLTVVFLGSTPIGSPIIGVVSELTDVRVALALGGLATGLATVWTARQMRTLGPRATQPRPASADRVGTGVEPAAA
jgi:Transmembrane secretion effector